MKQLASGSIADVLLARAGGLEGFARHVVIKRIQPELSREERFVTAFLEEARIAASLHHQNIVQVHDIGDEGGSFYFAMEYVHGEDCRKLINRLRERNEMMPLQHVVSIIMATAAGLHYAHEQVNPATGESKGIIHRDVSPANILIGYDGSVKLVDFGLAKAAARSTNATQSGTLKGKSSYMSPEQCMGKPLDRRTDTWSLGIVLFELLTAQRLFKGSNEFMTMAAIVDGEIPRPSTLRPDVPPALDEILMRALSRAPESRYQTAESMRESLEAFALAQELRTSNKALADYLTSLFGERLEPWLAESKPDPSWHELEGSHSGLVTKPRNQADMIAKFTTDGDSQDSPMALAQSLGAGEWLEEDEQAATSGSLPSLKRIGQPTEPTQTLRKTGAAEAQRSVNANVRPRQSEPSLGSPAKPRASGSEPPVNTGANVRPRPGASEPPAKPDFTETQKARPHKKDEPGHSTLVEPPIFDPTVRPADDDDDDDGLDDDEPATEIALDAPVHIPDPPKEKMPLAMRRPPRSVARLPDPVGEELPRQAESVPAPLRPVGRAVIPGVPTQSGMGVVGREPTPPSSPAAPALPPASAYPQVGSFAGVDPAQIAAGFQGQPRASSDFIYQGPPAPDVSLRGSNRIFVIGAVAVVLIIAIIFAARSCGDDNAAHKTAPADAEEQEHADDEGTTPQDKPDAAVRTRDAGARPDASKADKDDGSNTEASGAGSGSAKRPPKRPWPPKRPKGK